MKQPIPPPEYGGTQRSMAQMTAAQAIFTGKDIRIFGPSNSDILGFVEKTAKDHGLSSIIIANKIIIYNSKGRQTGSVEFISTGEPSTGYRNERSSTAEDTLDKMILESETKTPSDLIHCHAARRMLFLNEHNLLHKAVCHEHNRKLKDDYPNLRYPIIAISKSQADNLKRNHSANILGVAYHGLDPNHYRATTDHAGYFAWIGRICSEKGPQRAIRIAQEANKTIILAGTTNNNYVFEQFFKDEIMPHVNCIDYGLLDRMHDMSTDEVKTELEKLERYARESNSNFKNLVIFTGPANEPQKQALYGNAEATLFPISWSEPFGRVLIESIACGTPVLGYSQLGEIHTGAVREVIKDGVTGFLVSAKSEEEAVKQSVAKLAHGGGLDRSEVRNEFEKRWTSEINASVINDLYGLMQR